MVGRTYLDWNASAPLRVEARDALSAALALTGNPSSVHHEGRAARQIVEDARGAVAALVGADARNVIFTSGGTEANALALTPACSGGRRAAVRPPAGLGDRASFGAGGRTVRADCRRESFRSIRMA